MNFQHNKQFSKTATLNWVCKVVDFRGCMLWGPSIMKLQMSEI